MSQFQDGHYHTITEALVNAQVGRQRVLVTPGVYKESLKIDKPVLIIGDGPVEDIIVERTHSNCIRMLTDYAEIRGLTFKGPDKPTGVSYFTVDISQGKLNLKDCIISSDTLACIAIHGAKTELEMRECTLFEGKSDGVFVFDHGRANIRDCIITSNMGYGVRVVQGSEV